jgi:hypothetical protein
MIGMPREKFILGLRGIEWAIFADEGLTSRRISSGFGITAGPDFGIIGGWHEHRSEDGGFGIAIRFGAFVRCPRYAASSVLRRPA